MYHVWCALAQISCQTWTAQTSGQPGRVEGSPAPTQIKPNSQSLTLTAQLGFVSGAQEMLPHRTSISASSRQHISACCGKEVHATAEVNCIVEA